MRSVLKRESHSVFWWICVVILLCQIVLIGYCNFALGPKYVDCDSAKLYVHAIEMARNHSYVIPDWIIATTLEWDCSLLFAVPLFLLCQDIYVAFGISNLIMVFILIGILFYMFEGKSSLYPIVCANFILIPYGIGWLDYFNMMFFNGGQYIIKVLLPLLLVALLVHVEKGSKLNLKFVLWSIFYGILLLISTISSGIYILAVGIVPVLVGYFSYSLYRREKIPHSFWGMGAFSGILSVIGLLVNRVLATGAKGNSMTLCSVVDNELRDNITACFFGIFELFRGIAYENVEVMSVNGIRVLLHMGFVALMLLCACVLVRRTLHKKLTSLSVMLLAIFLWNTFVLCVCKTRYGASTFEYRYHLIGMIPLLCASVLLALEWFEKEDKHWKRAIAGVLIAMVLTLNITSFKGVFAYESDLESHQELCEYVKDSEIERVYFFLDSATSEICRLLGYEDEDAVYLAVNGLGDILLYDYYSKYLDEPISYDNAILVVNNFYYELGDEVELYGHLYKRIEVIGDFSIYQ